MNSRAYGRGKQAEEDFQKEIFSEDFSQEALSDVKIYIYDLDWIHLGY